MEHVPCTEELFFYISSLQFSFTCLWCNSVIGTIVDDGLDDANGTASREIMSVCETRRPDGEDGIGDGRTSFDLGIGSIVDEVF